MEKEEEEQEKKKRERENTRNRSAFLSKKILNMNDNELGS